MCGMTMLVMHAHKQIRVALRDTQRVESVTRFEDNVAWLAHTFARKNAARASSSTRRSTFPIPALPPRFDRKGTVSIGGRYIFNVVPCPWLA